MNQLSFFNTIDLHGPELATAQKVASTQEDKVLKVFQEAKYKTFTPAEVHIALGQQFLLTSVRRSISNLTKKGFLEQTEEMRPGNWNLPNRCWKLKL